MAGGLSQIMTINWTVTRAESKDIFRIASRAVQMFVEHGIIEDRQNDRAALHRDIEMDITACHANGCPLQLGRLRHADDVNFGHDVFGIRRFLNRKTGKVPANKFWPRFARKEGAVNV